jgi:hypothetical protein
MPGVSTKACQETAGRLRARPFVVLSDLRRALWPSPASCNRTATKRFRFCIGQIELARPFACIREGDPNRGTFAVWNLLA